MTPKTFRPVKPVYAILSFVLWILLFAATLVLGDRFLTWAVILLVPAVFFVAFIYFDPDLFLYSIIFFVPLSVKVDFPGGYALSFPSEALAVIMLGYLLVRKGSIRIPDRKIFSHPIFLILVIYLAWLLICSATSAIPLVSFKRTFIQIVYVSVFYFLFYTKFDQPANILKFYLFYALGLIIPIINGFIWHSKYNFEPQASYFMPQPFYTEHTIYGAALIFVIPVLFYLTFIPSEFNKDWNRKFLYGFLLLLCLTAEFFAYSRAAWISLLVMPVFLLIFRFRVKLAYLLLFAVFLGSIYFLYQEIILGLITRNEARSNKGNLTEQVESASNIQTDISNLERINRWKCAIRMFEDRPVTGYGPGIYQFVYYRYQVKNEMTRISTYHGERGNAHSEYLGYLCETGWPGLLIYLLSIILTLYTAIKIIYKTNDRLIRNLTITITLCLIPFYLHTIFNGFLENDEIGSLYFGSLGAITAIDIYFFRKQKLIT
jgi:putative inorganic carbon (HCO3(-)) transporter